MLTLVRSLKSFLPFWTEVSSRIGAVTYVQTTHHAIRYLISSKLNPDPGRYAHLHVLEGYYSEDSCEQSAGNHHTCYIRRVSDKA